MRFPENSPQPSPDGLDDHDDDRDAESPRDLAVRDPAAIAARNATVMANRGLIPWVARRFCGRGVPRADLHQAGYLGLIRAAEKFDPARGCEFSTYAIPWIRNFLVLEQRSYRFFAVAQHSRLLAARFRAARDRLAALAAAAGGRPPTPDEVFDELGVASPSTRATTLDAVLAEARDHEAVRLDRVPCGRRGWVDAQIASEDEDEAARALASSRRRRGRRR